MRNLGAAKSWGLPKVNEKYLSSPWCTPLASSTWLRGGFPFDTSRPRLRFAISLLGFEQSHPEGPVEKK
jgi:hypothetical protein